MLRINTQGSIQGIYKGLYNFKKLHFGVKVALSVFLQVMDTMLVGSDFVFAYLDDILVQSETGQQH